MTKTQPTGWATLACAAFAVATLTFGWHDAAAGAWLGIGTTAFAPLALRLAVARRRDASALPAAQVEALAWTESGWGGPSGGLRVARGRAWRAAGVAAAHA